VPSGSPIHCGPASRRTPPGSREFFEQHRQVAIEDCFAGSIDARVFPGACNQNAVLDLGCGPGFWLVELTRRGCTEVVGADLTFNAIKLARQRCARYDVTASFCQQDAERLGFADGSFAHVNCQGVIHHTPDTAACLGEIARVLRPGGTANISVYYRNVFLRMWPVLRTLGRFLARCGAGMKGRGRENIYAIADVDELVRHFDGADNPIGKSYTRAQFLAMLHVHFEVEETFLHFFPARSLPFRLPRFLHRWLDRHTGFLIFARLRKP